MRIIILGAGTVGESLARNLVKEDNDVVLIDISQACLDDIKLRLDVQTVHGNASNPSILIEAGIEQADLVIAVTTTDEANMIGCLIANKLFQVPRAIARIRSEDYHQYPALFKKNTIPIQSLIYPTGLVINHIIRMIEYPDFSQILTFFNDAVCIVSIETEENDWMNGKTVAHIQDKLQDIDIALTAIFNKKQAVPLVDTYILRTKDKVLFITFVEQLPVLLETLQRKPHSNRRIMIAGGGPLGCGLAKQLEEKYQVKLIEKTPERLEESALELNKTIVLHGDIADRELLLNENIQDMDIFCALTQDEEANIMGSLQAKYLGAKYAMSLVNRESYIDLIDDSLIDYAVSPQFITIGSILSKIRRGNMVKVHRLQDEEAEAIELIVEGTEKTSAVIGRPISEIELPPHCIMAGVIRGKHLHFITSRLILAAQDHVILLLLNKKYIHQLESLFQVNLTFMS
ncbi:MAG: Trk system potassium transporter TrkA [Legionella sp.]|nr:MAG: Trk system potassium transporter TrkA [Legionella sp.]